jgi:hypothetical protein
VQESNLRPWDKSPARRAATKRRKRKEPAKRLFPYCNKMQLNTPYGDKPVRAPYAQPQTLRLVLSGYAQCEKWELVATPGRLDFGT